MKSPGEYRLIMNEHNTIFINLLDEIVNSYPLYKMNQGVESYKNTYENDLQNLENLKADIFLNYNNLQNDSDKVSNFIKRNNQMIERLNRENRDLTEKLNTLENKDNAATRELVNSSTNSYIKFSENIILFSSAVSLIIFYGYYLKKKK